MRTPASKHAFASGFSLVELLVALALTGIVVAILGHLWNRSEKAVAAHDVGAMTEDLRNFVRRRLDCRTTLTAAVACDGAAVAVKGKRLMGGDDGDLIRVPSGDPASAASYSRFGALVARARCQPCVASAGHSCLGRRSELRVEINRVDAAGKLPDPQAGWKDLYTGMQLGCFRKEAP